MFRGGQRGSDLQSIGPAFTKSWSNSWLAIRASGLVLLLLTLSPLDVLGDGMVVPERFAPKVEIRSQQALIHFADGMEQLVIETSFLGAGTNFAWVVPLPATPQIQPVSETFFAKLQHAFQPRLVHQVHHYYLGFLFLCGLAYLAWRALREEDFWTPDLVLCLVLAAGAGLVGRHVIVGVIALAVALYVRLFSRSTANLAVVVVAGLGLSFYLSVVPNPARFFNTLGGDTPAKTVAVDGVTVVAAQRAGVFDVTTLRASSSAGVMEWMTPPS